MCSTTVHSEKVDITGKTMECEDLGFSIAFPPGAVISPVTVSVCCSFKREFSPPDGYQFVSPVYILHVHPETQFLKKVTLSLQHWAKSDGSDLRFASCPFPNKYHSYPFEVKDGGDFGSHGHYGRIEVDHFSLGTVIRAIGSWIFGDSGGKNYHHLLVGWFVTIIHVYFRERSSVRGNRFFHSPRKLLQSNISVASVH